MKSLFLCTALSLALAGNAIAQDRNFQQRRYYTVKRDQTRNFESTIKELNALVKKVNLDNPIYVLQGLTGPEQYVTIRYFEKMSDALTVIPGQFKEHAAEYQALLARLNSCVEERRSVIYQRDAELSLPRPADPSPYYRVIRTVVKPDKLAEYRELIKELVEKGVKPSGTKAYNVMQARLGASTLEFSSGTGLSSLAEVDENKALAALGDAARRQWTARRNALLVTSDVNIYRFRADLSYRPSTASN